jgi:hypothetical protein
LQIALFAVPPPPGLVADPGQAPAAVWAATWPGTK